jgi:glycosyltransferase involved in cell wall biosynthesis
MKIQKNDVVHIPLSPLIFPNSKFFLHTYCLLKKFKLIVNLHGDLCAEAKLKYKHNKKIDLVVLPTCFLQSRLLSKASRVVVNTYKFKKLVYTKYGVSNVSIIPNAISNSWHSKDKIAHPDKEKEVFKIFYHGRLSPEKGVDLLIESLSRLVETNDTFSKIILYIAGDGSQAAYLKQLCIKRGLQENIVFLGVQDPDDIMNYLYNVNVAVYPSIWDNFPLSFLEALYVANCPVLISKQAGIYDFIEKENCGILSFNPTVDNIYSIISQVMNYEIDISVVKNQKEFASNYVWDKIVDQYINLYSEVSKL